MIYERTHTGEKHYRCSFCIKMFAQNQDLKKHERTHTGEKTYACSYCDKKFEGNQNIKMHERIHTSKNHLNVYIVTKHLQERILWRNMKELIQMKNLIYVCNAFWGHLEVCKVLLEIKVTKIFIKIMDLLHFIWLQVKENMKCARYWLKHEGKKTLQM